MSQVSVIVPCYKYAHFLEECVASVLTQDGVDVRVLIIDDASPDNTAEVAAALAARDPRVEVLRHPTNRGNIATYNEGLAWASGDYTLLLSADDLLTPGALARAARVLDAHPEAGFVYGPAIRFTTDQPRAVPRVPPPTDLRWQVHPGHGWLEARCRTGYNVVWSPEVVVRTRLQHELGGYRPELNRTGDLEMWLRFAAHAGVAEILDADQAFYRIHATNMHLNHVAPSLALWWQTRAAFDAVFRDYGHRLPERDRLRRLAYRSLARMAVRLGGSAFDRTKWRKLVSRVQRSVWRRRFAT